MILQHREESNGPHSIDWNLNFLVDDAEKASVREAMVTRDGKQGPRGRLESRLDDGKGRKADEDPHYPGTWRIYFSLDNSYGRTTHQSCRYGGT
jgi:hypothetical protein